MQGGWGRWQRGTLAHSAPPSLSLTVLPEVSWKWGPTPCWTQAPRPLKNAFWKDCVRGRVKKVDGRAGRKEWGQEEGSAARSPAGP